MSTVLDADLLAELDGSEFETSTDYRAGERALVGSRRSERERAFAASLVTRLASAIAELPPWLRPLRERTAGDLKARYLPPKAA
jgi:hypothetical protein